MWLWHCVGLCDLYNVLFGWWVGCRSWERRGGELTAHQRRRERLAVAFAQSRLRRLRALCRSSFFITSKTFNKAASVIVAVSPLSYVTLNASVPPTETTSPQYFLLCPSSQSHICQNRLGTYNCVWVSEGVDLVTCQVKQTHYVPENETCRLPSVD